MTDLLGSTTTNTNEFFEDIVRQRMNRRGALKVALAAAGGAAVAAAGAEAVAAAGPYAPGELTYDAVPQNSNDTITVSSGFVYDVIISWGDPLVTGLPAFDVLNQSEADQNQRCGFNHDYLAFNPLPEGSSSSTDGLLWINHEYTDSTMMFETYTSTTNQIDVELAAHGGTVVRVTKPGVGPWTYDPSSSLNRRITGKTPMTLSGPVKNDNRVKTTADPLGQDVLGMLNNCGGGTTPWGTILTAEENFDQYFGNYGTMGTNPASAYSELSLLDYPKGSSFNFPAAASQRRWETLYTRFDMTIEPNEQLRFGWIVEIDPYDPLSVPKKRTSMGRFKHEAAAGTVSTGNKFVSYTGDDEVNQFIYKFVTANTIGPTKASNADLLDTGTLYVAKFNADGSGTWLPLTHGTGPLTGSTSTATTFDGQADVLMRARTAARLLGATKMSRPEDIEVNPITKKVYCVMTGNRSGEVNPANPRQGNTSSSAVSAGNALGHVIEITEAGGDNAALTFAWDVFMLCGMPNATGSVTQDSHPQPDLLTTTPNNTTYWAGFNETNVSPVARVDNVAFDSHGNMFLTTDGQPSALGSGAAGFTGWNDCLLGIPVDGAERGHGKTLMTAVDGCEVTGPFFTPDDKTVFCSIQHPGVDGFNWTSAATNPAAVTGNFAAPLSAWNTTPAIPTKTPGVPRPAALAIRRVDGTAVAYGESAVPPTDIPEFPLPALAVGASAAVAGLIAFRFRRMSSEA